MNKGTAILIFANSAEFEAVQKPFRSSETLFDALNEQTIKIVEKTGLPYFHFSEKNQYGATFGERFANAIQSIYDKGFQTVITIGNDTPHLQSRHILKAVQQLEQNDMVLGPSRDGGFYLMGLKRSYFNTETFLRLPWQTSRLNQSMSKLVDSKRIDVCFLETLSDIDTVSDAKSILDSFRRISKYIRQLVQSLISVEKDIYNTTVHFKSTLNQDIHFNKGSPFS